IAYGCSCGGSPRCLAQSQTPLPFLMRQAMRRRNWDEEGQIAMKTTSAGRLVLGIGFALALALRGNAAMSEDYPSRPITAIIPFAGGSASDVVSRIMFDKMSRLMGQPIIVENRPGAGGNIGTAMGAKAAPDGYTIVGGGSGPVAANVTLYK